MGQLVDGIWSDEWYDTKSTGGKFKRTVTSFRNWVTADGEAGPSGEGGFKAEAGRYHLYVSLACPWAHRTLIMRALKGLDDLISVSVVSPHMPDETGWSFTEEFGSTKDHLHGKQHLWQLYTHVAPDFTGRVTVPVLWDKQRDTIVSNESAEIIRMLNTAFNDLTGNHEDYCPDALLVEIDEVNARVYKGINNGVYKTGFATTQEAYEEAVTYLFDTLDWAEARLEGKDFLVGNQLTEADIRLFTTLIRFDAVYFGHFKCNIRRIADYPNLLKLTRRLYAMPEIRETVNIEHIKQHYYWSHLTINPTRVVPKGPDLGYLR